MAAGMSEYTFLPSSSSQGGEKAIYLPQSVGIPLTVFFQMETFQELLSCVGVTVFLSLLASFVISKLLAMECSRDPAPKNSLFSSVSNVIEKAVTFEPPKKGNGSYLFSSKESLDDDQTARVETRGSPLQQHALSDELVNVVETSREGYGEGITIEEKADYAYLAFDESPVLCEDQLVREIEIESADVSNLLDLKGLERNEEDDWEGIERSELEKHFGDATIFVEESTNLENDVKLQLYGLSKIALEGPCIAPQPMALKITARAKWNAWQQLTHMSRETAMEQYISLLSKSIPDWKGRDVNEEIK